MAPLKFLEKLSSYYNARILLIKNVTEETSVRSTPVSHTFVSICIEKATVEVKSYE